MTSPIDGDGWSVLIFGYLIAAIIVAISVGTLSGRPAYGFLTLGGLCLLGVILLYVGLRREPS